MTNKSTVFKEINYKVSNQHKWTLNIKAIKDFVFDNLDLENDLIVNPFAGQNPIIGKKRIYQNAVNNDLYVKTEHTMYNLDAVDFLKTFKDNTVDVVFFDPPYANPLTLKKLYGIDITMQEFNKWIWNIKKEIARVLRVGGKCISIGYETNGIGSIKGFEKDKLLVVAHGGLLRDTFAYTEIKVESGKHYNTWRGDNNGK